MVNKITKLFPLWAIVFSIGAYIFPEYFSNFSLLIIPLLIIIMFSMGITLTLKDFVRVIKEPKIIFIGVLLQYLIMPAAAFFISKLFDLNSELLVGMVLVGSVAGGTASNVICYFAKADVALSVTLTTFSTLLAFIFTPVLTYFYAGQYIPVPIINMLLSILKIVLLPIIIGVLLNRYFYKQILSYKEILPLISMIAIISIIAIIVALNNENIKSMGGILIFAIICHNLLGLSFGYFIPQLLGYNEKICRTISIEVGMQNSGLAVALASKYFPTLTALPGAIFSIWHNLSGSLIASYWQNKKYFNKS